jgi:hypothetical protein
LHLIWQLIAELPPVLLNQPVFDLEGRLLGVPDLFDATSGTGGEYDGEHHKAIDQHRRDVAREEGFRDHGLEYFTVVRGDSRISVAARMRRTRTRAKFLPPESRAWTVEPPTGYRTPETLDDYFERVGLVESLTHR